MKRVVSIHQPNYIPYLGILYKIDKSDTFVFLDDAQYSNNGMHDYNCIRTGETATRLRIPIEKHFGQAINEVRTKDELLWKEDHLKKIHKAYFESRFGRLYIPQFEKILMRKYKSLAEMNEHIILWMMDGFGMDKEVILSSELGITSKKEERVLDILTRIRKDGEDIVYYSGNGARTYQNEEDFKERGIELMYSDYQPTSYPQQGKGFILNMSALDYIFNCGFKKPW